MAGGCWCRSGSSACRASWLSCTTVRRRSKRKKVIEALDLSPVLDEHLLKLGKWIADYYLAPVGEVFRTMLPLSAEFKRSIAYRITDEGRMALHLAGMSGSPARSKRTPDEQLVEFRVLDYLAERESVREESLRGATRVAKALLSGMVRKKWIAREDVSAARDAARLVKVAVLRSVERRGVPLAAESDDGSAGRPRPSPHTNSAKKLNENQLTLMETLAAAGGECPSRPCAGWMCRAPRWARWCGAG